MYTRMCATHTRAHTHTHTYTQGWGSRHQEPPAQHVLQPAPTTHHNPGTCLRRFRCFLLFLRVSSASTSSPRILLCLYLTASASPPQPRLPFSFSASVFSSSASHPPLLLLPCLCLPSCAATPTRMRHVPHRVPAHVWHTPRGRTTRLH